MPDGSQDHPFDTIVVGAGIVGCAIATTFARQGRHVLLLERSLKEPDRMVGELLQPGGVKALRMLGMGACLEEIEAIPVKGFEVFYRGENITFFYPGVDGSGNVSGVERPEGRSFCHGKFVSRLRETARAEENVTLMGSTVKGLVKCKKSGRVLGVRCQKSDGDGKGGERSFFSHLTIIADGQASNFRSEMGPRKPISKSRFWGLELVDAVLPTRERAFGVIGNGPPILIYQTGAHTTRILIDIPNGVYASLCKTGNVKEYIRDTVIPTLPECVQPAVIVALGTGRLRSMPNSWLPPSLNKIPGMVILGDAMNMRHPLVGGGMTVGLNDVLLMSCLLSPSEVPSFLDTRIVLRQMKSLNSQRKGVSMTLNVLAQALYSLFVADDPQLQVLQRGFIRYIQRGGSYIEEPAGLLGGVIHSPWLLFYHFFSVALYSLWLYIQESCRKSPWNIGFAITECVRVFVKACEVILPFLLLEVWS